MKAYAWYKLAAQNHNQQAQTALTRLTPTLMPNEKTAGDALFLQLQKKSPVVERKS